MSTTTHITTTQTKPETKSETKPEAKAKAIIVGRHKLLLAQEEAVSKLCERLGVELLKERVEQIPPGEEEKVAQALKEKGVRVLIVQALPIDILAKMLKHFEVFFMKMQQVALVESEEVAQRLVQEAPHKRVAIPGAVGEKKTFRVMEFVGITRVKRIVIEEEFVVQV